jgi:hypothetical protein
MKSLHLKSAVALLGAGAVVLASTSVGFASTGTHKASDTDDHFSVKAGTVITGNLKSGTSVTFKGSIDGIALTVTCTTFTASGKAPATGLSATLPVPPTLSGCMDTLGGTDTVKTNSTNGKWKIGEIDAPNDEAATEPNTGDKFFITIPKAGATFTSSVLSACVITAAPNGPVKITGSYDDVSTATVTNSTIPTSGSGCSSTSATTSATEVLSPSVHDVS